MGRKGVCVIHLDANYLILGASAANAENAHLQAWLRRGELLGTSAVAWMEFVTGPVTPAVVDSVRRVLEDRIVPVGLDEAELAARLFNAIGRKRSARYDCMIAATAIQNDARLATNNITDYRAFAPLGLQLL
jgi:predicted nucleic acid-binding protein